MTELHPIDTAPRDSTPIVLWHEDWGIFPIGWWIAYDDEVSGWAVSKGFFPNPMKGFLWPRGNDADTQPTHWMPAPELPKE